MVSCGGDGSRSIGLVVYLVLDGLGWIWNHWMYLCTYASLSGIMLYKKNTTYPSHQVPSYP